MALFSPGKSQVGLKQARFPEEAKIYRRVAEAKQRPKVFTLYHLLISTCSNSEKKVESRNLPVLDMYPLKGSRIKSSGKSIFACERSHTSVGFTSAEHRIRKGTKQLITSSSKEVLCGLCSRCMYSVSMVDAIL